MNYNSRKTYQSMRFLAATICTSILSSTLAMPTHYEIRDAHDPTSENQDHVYNFTFVTRAQWQARDPTDPHPLVTPVPYVVIHHSHSPPACCSLAECSKAMRSIQKYHMDDRHWSDIGYNFAVGGDGAVYEGRGWKTIGAHALNFNSVSIGIVLIGDWTSTLPPAEQLKSAKLLIDAGVKIGYIKNEYKLVGHRQVRDTVCPGDVLYQEIQHWPHYSNGSIFIPHASNVSNSKDPVSRTVDLHKSTIDIYSAL